MTPKLVVIRTLNELQVLLKDLSSKKDNTTNISADIVWSENDKDVSRRLTASTTTHSDMAELIKGIKQIKKKMEIYDKIKKLQENEQVGIKVSDEVLDVNKQKHNVDMLIRDRLGGKRNGLRVRWELEDGVFEFAPLDGDGKLYKVEK